MPREQDACLRRDLTLTESTGMLVDAALERGRREALERNHALLSAERAELEQLARELDKRRQALRRRQRRVRMAMALGISLLALIGGFALGHWIWQSDGTASFTSVEVSS